MTKKLFSYGTILFFRALLTTSAADDATRPHVYGLPVQNLIVAKQRVAEKATWVVPTYDKLIEKANAALLSHPRSVMNKPKVAASGDKHDFFSYGPYWWPDPSKPDGLPYIKRDGYLYPGSKMGTDPYW